MNSKELTDKVFSEKTEREKENLEPLIADALSQIAKTIKEVSETYMEREGE